MTKKRLKAIICAVLAAALYALNTPVSKVLLKHIEPDMLAGLLYLGAGTGMFIMGLLLKNTDKEKKEKNLTKAELPYTIGMVLLDIAAPILLMIGLSMSSASSVSLLNNFEIVSTACIASLLFHEKISGKLWIGIGLITAASILLSVESAASFRLSIGSLFVLGACVCWGFENNCTRKMSAKNPLEIVIIKGFGSGIGAMAIAFAAGESVPSWNWILLALLLGFAAYGLSIYFYIYAQRDLGAARTSAYYGIAPFIGAFLSLVFLHEPLTATFAAALIIMAAGSIMASQ